MGLRLKTILSLVFISFLGTVFLWLFHIFYVLRNWALLTQNIDRFLINVVLLLSVSSLILYFLSSPLAKAEKKIKKAPQV